MVRNTNCSGRGHFNYWSKRFSNCAKKIGSWIGSFKNYFSEVQKGIIDMENKIEEEINLKKILQIKQIIKKMDELENKQSSFVEHLTELRSRLVKSVIYLFIFLLFVIFLQKIFMLF